MDVLHIGLPILLHWQNLAAVVVGCIVGLWAGALPGFSGVSATAVMLPLTFTMDSATALILLTSVYTASEYGGSISAILINVPGDPTAAAAAFDGYPMARQGKAGVALGVSSAASLFGATAGSLILVTAAQPLLRLVIGFGPSEYFALAVLGLTIVSAVSSGSMLKGFLMSLLGIAISSVGLDSIIGVPRFTFGFVYLEAGINFVPVVTGLFAISELVFLAERGGTVASSGRLTGNLWQGVAEVIHHKAVLLKSLAIGTFIGLMPGVGAAAANFLAYNIVQRTSRDPKSFGTGNPEGVIAPEVANNACVHASMIPALTLGIPGGASSAMLVVVMTVHGIQPGQELFSSNPGLINGLFAGLFASAITSFILMTVFIRIFARVTVIPAQLLAPVLLILSIIAVFATSNSLTDLFVCALFGVIGYVLRRTGFPLVNLIMGLVLGKLMELSFVQALSITNGSPILFYTRPWTAGMLAIAISLFLWSIGKAFSGRFKRHNTV